MAIDRRTMVGCGEKAISANTNGDENRSFAKQLSEWLSIRLQRIHASLDECREPFKGTVRTPSMRRAVDIVSKPRIWSHGANAISLGNRPTFHVAGSGRTVISSASTA